MKNKKNNKSFKLILGCLTALILLSSVSLIAQSSNDLIFDMPTDTAPVISYEGIPRINITTRAISLQHSLFPDYYQTHSALRDLRWVERNDSAFTDFWETNGPFVLNALSELSGLEWLEGELDIYLVRYYHSIGNGDPLIIPIGGIRKGTLTESMPTDIRMQLNLVYHLSKRMLSQAERFEEEFRHPISSHPLMQSGPHRRDNLAMLLTLVTCEKLIGLDSTFAAYQSSFWKQRHPGREVFEKYLLTDWILSSEKPLTRWILDEAYNSKLVSITRPPRAVKSQGSDKPMKYIEDLPLKGHFGFSLKIDFSNKRIIHKIDPERIAFACGLREGDIVRSVDGKRIRNQRDMIEKIMVSYEGGGSTLQIVREEVSMTILIQPLDLGYDDTPFQLWDDSLETPSDSSEYQMESDG